MENCKFWFHEMYLQTNKFICPLSIQCFSIVSLTFPSHIFFHKNLFRMQNLYVQSIWHFIAIYEKSFEGLKLNKLHKGLNRKKK